jgi:hypothetical protein
MPQDGRSEAIPVLGFKKDGNQTITSNAGGTARTTELTTAVVTVVSSEIVRLAQGKDDTVEATADDCKLYPNIPYDISLMKNGTYMPFIAFRTVDVAATVDVAERD